MEVQDYENLISGLDTQIQEVGNARKTREMTIKRLKLVRHWKEGIEARARQLTELKTPVPQQAMESLVKLRGEEKELQEKLDSLPEIPEVEGQTELFPAEDVASAPSDNGHPVLAMEDKLDLFDLIEEIENTELTRISDEERWLIFPVWATRWRLFVETVGQGHADYDRDIRRCFAIIRERTTRFKHDGTPFIPALHPKKQKDWNEELWWARKKRKDFHTRNAEQRRRRLECDRGIEELQVLLGGANAISTEEIERHVQHLVRTAAREPDLRTRLAVVCKDYQDKLGSEFAYLWKKPEKEEAEEETPTKSLSHRELVEKILRRMISNTAIGGCHVPVEKVQRGFPSHQAGTAKDAIDRLHRSGILKIKGSAIGDRVAIESTMMNLVNKFLEEGGELAAVVDEWMKEE